MNPTMYRSVLQWTLIWNRHCIEYRTCFKSFCYLNKHANYFTITLDSIWMSKVEFQVGLSVANSAIKFLGNLQRKLDLELIYSMPNFFCNHPSFQGCGNLCPTTATFPPRPAAPLYKLERDRNKSWENLLGDSQIPNISLLIGLELARMRTHFRYIYIAVIVGENELFTQLILHLLPNNWMRVTIYQKIEAFPSDQMLCVQWHRRA